MNLLSKKLVILPAHFAPRILDLRARARKALGPKFSYARFHRVVRGVAAARPAGAGEE
jgi:hypothetical protein